MINILKNIDYSKKFHVQIYVYLEIKKVILLILFFNYKCSSHLQETRGPWATSLT